MDDRDLTNLSDGHIPPPSPGAKERAIHAALVAFEEEADKSATSSQGLPAVSRLNNTYKNQTWVWIMQRRGVFGALAAALLVVPAAGYLTMSGNFGKNDAFHRTMRDGDIVVSEKPVPLKKSDDSPAATAPIADLERKEGAQVGGLFNLNGGSERQDASEVPAPSPAMAPPPQPVTTANKLKAEADRRSAARSFNSATQLKGLLSGKMQPSTGGRVAAAKPLSAQEQSLLRAPADGLGMVRAPAGITPDGFERLSAEEKSRDKFEGFLSNPLKAVKEQPVSTFSIDVDTASYAFMRRQLQRGVLPPKNAVRVEEMINYFSYDYPVPEDASAPFKPSIAIYPTPWNPNTKLLHIGIKGHEITGKEKPRSNLVFLVDVSGSMQSADKLPLLKNALRLLVGRLQEDDSVAIVTYAGQAGTVLEPTKLSDKRKILAALDKLQSGGSTAGAQGIRQAYALAEANFSKDSVNRIILATDGDFNVGITDKDALKSYVEEKRKSGIYLSVLGFGMGNYNDALMQTLAQNGNGNAAYIDGLREAQKTLVEEASSTLFPIAKDVKIQVEFNPAMVSEYRLIGYETRALKREDFNNDKVDAGDIGSGHTVTAIYEITPADSAVKMIDDLRYSRNDDKPSEAKDSKGAGEYAFLKMRYKLPKEDVSKLITVPITPNFERSKIDAVSKDMRFAASVAAFGQKLRGDSHIGDFSYDDVIALASPARGADPYGYRSEFISLVRLAKSLTASDASSVQKQQE